MRRTGADFEQRAGVELERAGLKPLARNYTTRHGEIDLVMLDRDTVVFVEVRYRVRADHGDALASITRGKQDKLIRTAQLWLAAHPHHAQRPCRFDVVSYDGPAANARMQWVRGAFEAG
jgi:putative endonuclease